MIKPLKLWLYALPVLIILVVTLVPASGPAQAVTFCIACGRRGIADGVLNAMLFFPLGFVPVEGSRSPARRVLAGFMLSVFVEVIQAFVPGRDPSLSNVVFNTIGTILGVYASQTRRHWLDPDSNDSRILSSASVAAAIIIATGTILSLSPLDPSSWTARRFKADIARIDSLNNLQVLALIPLTPGGENLTIERWGDALGLAYPTWAGAHGLDEPVYWSYAILQQRRPPFRMSLEITRRSWMVAADSAAEKKSVGPSIGLGWALLIYPDAVGPRWIFLLGAMWLAGLCFPIGYWSSRRHFIGAGGAVMIGFFVIPFVTGGLPVSLLEWAGVVLGLLVGQTVGALRVPWRSNY